MKLVSIVIPTYNRKELVINCINSLHRVINKTDHDYEIIVVDDGSTDGTNEAIKEQFHWVRYYLQENSGAPKARNHGVSNSNGKYILLLDSDDLIEPGFFEPKIALLENNPELAGAYGPFDYFSGEKGFKEQDVIPRHKPYPLEGTGFKKPLQRLLGGWFIPSHAILWRKEVLDQVNGQNTALRINQDVDLMFRILVKGNPIAGVESGRALIRMHRGERVGGINKSPDKLRDIYKLRLFFTSELNKHQLLEDENRRAIANYCFNMWVSYYRTLPDISDQFLELANELYPKLNVKGHWYFKMLGKIFGKTKAVRIKHFLSR